MNLKWIFFILFIVVMLNLEAQYQERKFYISEIVENPDQYENGIEVSQNWTHFHDIFFEQVPRLVNESLDDINPQEKNFYDFYYNFHKHYQSTTKIDKEHGGDYFQTPKEFIANDLQGDCDDSSLLLVTVARKYGHRAKFVVGMKQDAAHAWISVYYPPIWLEFDSTERWVCDGCISEKYKIVEEVEV